MLLGKAIAANQKDKDSFGEAEVGIAREFEGISHIRVCDERMNNSVIPLHTSPMVGQSRT